MRQSTVPRRTRVLLAAIITSVAGLSGRAAAQSASPLAASAVQVASPVQAGPLAPAVDSSAAPRSLMLDQRPVALTRQSSPMPAPLPRQESGNTRANTAMMIVGAAAVVLGAAIGDDAGTVLIVGGAGIGLFGLYRFLN